jgi:hypothetical protein
MVYSCRHEYHNRCGKTRARSASVASEQATTTKHTVNLKEIDGGIISLYLDKSVPG